MSSRVKISTAKKTMKDPQLIELFNQMVGTSAPDPNVVIPKYEKLLGITRDIVSILGKFTISPCQVLKPDFEKGFADIDSFVSKANEELATLTVEPKENNVLSQEELDLVNTQPNTLEKVMQNMGLKYDVNELGEAYKNLKDSEVVKAIIMTYRQLKEALVAETERKKIKTELFETEHDLVDKKNLSVLFIRKSIGHVLHLFSFSNIDFKGIDLSPIVDKKMRQYILFMLSLIYDRCDEVYKLVTSPDVDVAKFSEALVGNIDSIRKRIPRCDAAFDKIKESVELLQGNFSGYYKDFISSQNPGIIVEHFVLDVAKDSKTNSKVTRQFREIIKFYKKNMAGQIKDPKLQRIFNLVGKNLDILEKKTGSKKDGSDDDDEEETDDTDEQEKEPPTPMTEEEKKVQQMTFLPDHMKNSKKKKRPPKRRNRKR
jgi:hypothetical protein